MMARGRRPNYLAIWGWLMALAIISILLSRMPLAKWAIVALIFVLAAAKALLVAMNYMHLKYERLLIYGIALVPVVLAIGLMLVLFPDMVFRP